MTPELLMLPPWIYMPLPAVGVVSVMVPSLVMVATPSAPTPNSVPLMIADAALLTLPPASRLTPMLLAPVLAMMPWFTTVPALVPTVTPEIDPALVTLPPDKNTPAAPTVLAMVPPASLSTIEPWPSDMPNPAASMVPELNSVAA